MTSETFSKLMAAYRINFHQLQSKLQNSEDSISVNIDRQIVWCCLRNLDVVTKVVPQSFEISSHMARFFMELEVILKWLKQDPVNYEAFVADAEHANLNLHKSKRDAVEVGAPQYLEKFQKNILMIEENIRVNGYDKYKEKLSELRNLKQTTLGFDEVSGKVFKAAFDYYSKMAHPTAWLILTEPVSEEITLIQREAMSGINKALILILNRLGECYLLSKKIEDL